MKSETRSALLIFAVILAAFLLTLSGCSFRKINRSKNIVYLPKGPSGKQELNIFSPARSKSANDVLVFIHGGNWNSGKKSQYNIIANHWAKKGIVCLMIDYPLSPQADYKEMAAACAQAVKWVKEDIRRYNGNPDRIFVSGHSAGGHLAALISIDDQYFKGLKIKNPIAGTILIDAAGLDMYGYLEEEKLSADHTYLKTFTKDPKIWKEATPLYHLHRDMPPMLIYRGEKTYDSILKSNEKFTKALDQYAPDTPYHIVNGKKHIPMITQFFNPWNRYYREIIEFMAGVGTSQ
ncbi:alpha/beta hydrolase [Dyadobacter luteus]|uniref:alpha/beta hydrolase n=1 Tax=Dyadobacter luteus TaxID=2259619 RepID=UPI001E29CECF|nr:alpha/beta hydrolase [Dyadobacter luteus]